MQRAGYPAAVLLVEEKEMIGLQSRVYPQSKLELTYLRAIFSVSVAFVPSLDSVLLRAPIAASNLLLGT